MQLPQCCFPGSSEAAPDSFQDSEQRPQQLWCLPGVALVWQQPLLASATAGGGLEGSEPQREEMELLL